MTPQQLQSKRNVIVKPVLSDKKKGGVLPGMLAANRELQATYLNYTQVQAPQPTVIGLQTSPNK